MRHHLKGHLAALISLFILGGDVLAGETWVLIGSEIEPRLLNAPDGSLAKKNGIAGFGWLVDLQSIVKQNNLVFYHERGTVIDKNGNSIKNLESKDTFLRIIDCESGLMKFKENNDWSIPTPEHRKIVKFMCPEKKARGKNGNII